MVVGGRGGGRSVRDAATRCVVRVRIFDAFVRGDNGFRKRVSIKEKKKDEGEGARRHEKYSCEREDAPAGCLASLRVVDGMDHRPRKSVSRIDEGYIE